MMTEESMRKLPRRERRKERLRRMTSRLGRYINNNHDPFAEKLYGILCVKLGWASFGNKPE